MTPDPAQLAADGALTATLTASGRYRRWLPDWEVEAKYAIDHPSDDPTELLALTLDGRQPFLVDRVGDGVTCVHPTYLVEDDVEYSFFVYRGDPMVKIKKHAVDSAGDLPVMVSTEHFLTGLDALHWRVGAAPSLSAPLEKNRSKVFLHDPDTATCYSAAVTVCRYRGKVQKQFELEYYASDVHAEIGAVAELVDRVRGAARQLRHHAGLDLAPTSETKFAFLQGASAVTA